MSFNTIEIIEEMRVHPSVTNATNNYLNDSGSRIRIYVYRQDAGAAPNNVEERARNLALKLIDLEQDNFEYIKLVNKGLVIDKSNYGIGLIPAPYRKLNEGN